MNFFFIFIVFIFTISAAQSRETLRHVKSFKVNEKITYDCVDIYKQPSLSHPLLKNHKIQMKPSFSISKPKNQVNRESESRRKFECPDGTVPIIRNTKESMVKNQSTAEKHFGVLTTDHPGIHVAGVSPTNQGPFRGVAAAFTVHDLNISEDQTSYVAMYVTSEVNKNINYISAGWMVSPSLFGDGRTWGYGFWMGPNQTGCYNTMCPGFIQVSSIYPISGPIPYPPKGQDRSIYITIQEDDETGHWWTTDVVHNGEDILIGYWPKELFDNLIGFGVDSVGVTGAVKASPTGESPPMGNGHLPTDDDMQSARVDVMKMFDIDFRIKESSEYKLEKLIDNSTCYGIKDGKNSVLFTYGGPGGDYCGV